MKQSILRILTLVGLMAGLAASVSAYEPMLVEGRTWEYINVDPWNLYSLKIGESSEKYGKMYSPVIRLESGDTIALLREEPGKVFMLMGRSGPIIDVYNGNTIGSYTPDQETPVYDFTKNIGDSICLLNNPGIYDSDTMETLQGKLILEEKSTETILGIERIRQEWYPREFGFNGQTAIEGIGTLDEFFPFFDPRPLCVSSSHGTSSYRLVRVYDKDGTLIFDYYNYNGTESNIVDNDTDGRMYDLMGREIREPQLGTVYIQNGLNKVQR